MQPKDPKEERLNRFIVRQIRRSRRRITIMFTDVVGSTQYWENRGDLEGRLMIDIHNRLISPIIKRYGGKVIKHVGDSVMASFRSPKNALSAAISIQQKMQDYRENQDQDLPSIRIGLHTGKALVEDGDVFGRVVNIASRINDYAEGDGISASRDTVRGLNRKAFNLHREGRYVLKGMQKSVTLFRCDWQQHPSLIDKLREETPLELVRKQRKFMLAGVFLILAAFSFFCFQYLRYPMAMEPALAALNLELPPLFLTGPALLGVLSGLGWLLFYWTPLVAWFFRMIRGGAAFSIAFLLVYGVAGLLPDETSEQWQREIHGSEGSFVEALARDVPIYPQTNEGGEPLAKIPWRQILPIEDAREQDGRAWLQVRCGPECRGWVVRDLPREENANAPANTSRSRVIWLTVRYRDFFSLLAGVAGLLWGYASFRIRPA
jgi:class 3 adenylate cyclase